MYALSTLLKSLTSRSAKSPSRRDRRSKAAFRPTFDVLEDRLVMSGAPAAPVLVANDISATQISLSWNRVSNATGYLVDEYVNGAWKQMANYNSNTIGCTFSGLSVGVTYNFDVAAYNSSGTTWSAVQHATTVDHPAASAAYSPVSGSLFGANGPVYQDVRQGGVGDCWVLASLAEVAARTPNTIRSMFTYMGTNLENGATVSLYSVRLYDTGGTARSIVVDTELPGGGGTYDQATNGVLWVALAEKAYAQANGMRLVGSNQMGTDSYNALKGGDPAWALHAITDRSAGDYSINPTNLASAWNKGQLIVLISSNRPASSYIVGSPTDGTHAYALVNYNASSSNPFQVFNPWGTDSQGWAPELFNGHKVYGLFTANGAFLSQNFTTQVIASAAPTVSASGDAAGAVEVQVCVVAVTVTATGVAPHGTTQDLVTQPAWTRADEAALASLSQGLDRSVSDAFWADAGNTVAAADFLAQEWVEC